MSPEYPRMTFLTYIYTHASDALCLLAQEHQAGISVLSEQAHGLIANHHLGQGNDGSNDKAGSCAYIQTDAVPSAFQQKGLSPIKPQIHQFLIQPYA